MGSYRTFTILQDCYGISAKSHKIPVKSHNISCKKWGGATNHHGGGAFENVTPVPVRATSRFRSSVNKP